MKGKCKQRWSIMPFISTISCFCPSRCSTWIYNIICCGLYCSQWFWGQR